jgi:hypothetical protein
MDQGNEFECEFRARRIRVRGNFAHKSLLKLSTVPPVRPMRCVPMRSAPMRYTHEIHAYEMHA